jgi:hypothetical protein
MAGDFPLQTGEMFLVAVGPGGAQDKGQMRGPMAPPRVEGAVKTARRGSGLDNIEEASACSFPKFSPSKDARSSA